MSLPQVHVNTLEVDSVTALDIKEVSYIKGVLLKIEKCPLGLVAPKWSIEHTVLSEQLVRRRVAGYWISVQNESSVTPRIGVDACITKSIIPLGDFVPRQQLLNNNLINK